MARMKILNPQFRRDEEEWKAKQRGRQTPGPKRGGRDNPTTPPPPPTPEPPSQREESLESDQEDYGSDPSPGSVETDRPRPGFSRYPQDIGNFEEDPNLVMPTIEEGRDPLLALRAQRGAYQVAERRFRHQLVERDDQNRAFMDENSRLRAEARVQTDRMKRFDDLADEQQRMIRQLNRTRPSAETLRARDRQVENQAGQIQDQAQEIHNQAQRNQVQAIRITNQNRTINRLAEECQIQQDRAANAERLVQILRQQLQDQAEQAQAQIQARDRQIAAWTANAAVPQAINAPPQRQPRPRQRHPRPPRQRRHTPPSPAARRLPRACKNKVASYKEPRG